MNELQQKSCNDEIPKQRYWDLLVAFGSDFDRHIEEFVIMAKRFEEYESKSMRDLQQTEDDFDTLRHRIYEAREYRKYLGEVYNTKPDALMDYKLLRVKRALEAIGHIR